MKITLAILKTLKMNLTIRTYLVLISFTLCTCTYDDFEKYKSDGIITGQDYKMCICCGGWEININDQTYHFDVLPSNSRIDLDNEKFPLKVKLDWEIDKTVCKWIIISRIGKI